MRNRAEIDITIGATNRPGDNGVLPKSFLVSDRRSKKVGALPDSARMVLSAARRCLPDDLAELIESGEHLGVSLGTLCGSMAVAEKCLRTVKEEGFRQVMPSWYANGLPNATAAVVASVHGLIGPNFTLLGYSAGIEAVILGCRQIRAGRACAVLAGGFDLMSPRHAGRLGNAVEYREASALRSGAGLVWLSSQTGTTRTLARIVGWSQGVRFGNETDEDVVAKLMRAAIGDPRERQTATTHLINPSRKGQIDYLAATAPIYLVESVLYGSAPGLHALVVRGFGQSAACLAIEVFESMGMAKAH